MKTFNLLFSILIVSCSDPINDNQHNLVGVTYGGNCDLNKMPTLIIDPDWSDNQVNNIRAAAKQWEDAIGVDLGALSISNVDCEGPGKNWVKGCIVKVQNINDICTYDENDKLNCIRAKTPGIVIDAHADIQQVSAHEFGHWVGIKHINNNDALMCRTSMQKTVTEIDINEYEKVCL